MFLYCCKVEAQCLSLSVPETQFGLKLLCPTTQRPRFRGNIMSSSDLLWCQCHVITLMPQFGCRVGYRFGPLTGSHHDKLLVKMTRVSVNCSEWECVSWLGCFARFWHHFKLVCEGLVITEELPEKWKAGCVMLMHVSLVCSQSFLSLDLPHLNLIMGGIFK